MSLTNKMFKFSIINIILIITIFIDFITTINIDNNDNYFNISKKLTSLRQRFEIIGDEQHLRNKNNNDNSTTHIVMSNNFQNLNHKTHTTFRPSSAILYLHPSKPRHIKTIDTEVIMLNLNSTEIIISWKVIVHLRKNETSLLTNITNNVRLKRKIDAKVEEDINPISFNLYIRQYGKINRKKIRLIDEQNTLDPPITNNKTYQHRIDGLKSMTAYELCLQSLNAGQIKESVEISQQFPVNALTELAGRNNPLFICKEIVLPSSSSSSSLSSTQTSKLSNNSNIIINEKKFKGRSGNLLLNQNTNSNYNNNNDNSGSTTTFQIDEEMTDKFVLYTAITTGTTTVFIILILFVFCCCCRCHRRYIEHKQQQQLQQALIHDFVNLNNNNNPNNIVIQPYSDYYRNIDNDNNQ